MFYEPEAETVQVKMYIVCTLQRMFLLLQVV